jgi:hypothetical protein
MTARFVLEETYPSVVYLHRANWKAKLTPQGGEYVCPAHLTCSTPSPRGLLEAIGYLEAEGTPLSPTWRHEAYFVHSGVVSRRWPKENLTDPDWGSRLDVPQEAVLRLVEALPRLNFVGAVVPPDEDGRCGVCGGAGFRYRNGAEQSAWGEKGYRCGSCMHMKAEDWRERREVAQEKE